MLMGGMFLTIICAFRLQIIFCPVLELGFSSKNPMHMNKDVKRWKWWNALGNKCGWYEWKSLVGNLWVCRYANNPLLCMFKFIKPLINLWAQQWAWDFLGVHHQKERVIRELCHQEECVVSLGSFITMKSVSCHWRVSSLGKVHHVTKEFHH